MGSAMMDDAANFLQSFRLSDPITLSSIDACGSGCTHRLHPTRMRRTEGFATLSLRVASLCRVFVCRIDVNQVLLETVIEYKQKVYQQEEPQVRSNLYATPVIMVCIPQIARYRILSRFCGREILTCSRVLTSSRTGNNYLNNP